MRAGVIEVSRPTLENGLVDPLVSLAGAAGIALLVPFVILVIGTPVALTVRGLLEGIGWLFGIVPAKPGQVRGWIQESAMIRD